MPSPFPGMDPYIEDPEIWSDFHGGIADETRAELNSVLLPRYVARMTPRVTYEIDVWPIQLWQRLPVLSVPLLEPDPDVPLDLGTVVAAVYERGAYARLIDYRLPPPPPALSEAQAAWLEERLCTQ